jgi:tRNA threonylcarbamoyl adenosine modification protein YeaZ
VKLLAVDTALGACSAALLDDERVLAHRFVVMERGHAEALAPMVDDAMREAGIGFDALDRLAVTTGPGTFTGQRVGLAFMRGLRVALKIPLIGITTLDAMAAAAMDETGAPYAAALHDAKRSEVYFGLSSRDTILIEPRLIPLDEVAKAIRDCLPADATVAFAGTAGGAACEQWMAGGHNGVASSILQPDAKWVAKLALNKPASHEPPRPLYLRPADARLPASA